ncbi:MAG: 2Fe-2S iron-sulfur cluster-binding protein [Bdellovibrionota bacterium]|jgi:NADH-quinone oxidoreductase subunit G
MVSLTIDGQAVVVPEGTNLIEAAATIGIEIPHFCYHPCLSVVGNCRMCQVEVAKAPKLMIACHTLAAEGMEVHTHHSSQAVRDAQAAVLEFLLINHPLDCTVCDQAGQCKLQDMYFKYSKKNSRFNEEKERKQKALPLGKNIIYDAERCIKCSRCIRFCREITQTAELGMLNRGDATYVAVTEGRELDNPFSGCVADLCPVGALTHRKWRFKSRSWLAKEVDTICLGCSSTCACTVSIRDGEVVQVKGRSNELKNNEWLCDEGRYGFDRFLPKERLHAPYKNGKALALEDALTALQEIGSKPLVAFFSADLTLEEYYLWKKYLDAAAKLYVPAVAIAGTGTKGVGVLQDFIAKDGAANLRSAERVGLISGDAREHYINTLKKFENGVYQRGIFIGDRAILPKDIDDALLEAVSKLELSVAILCNAKSPLLSQLKVVLPGRSAFEKSGSVINRDGIVQSLTRIVSPAAGTLAEWQYANLLALQYGRGYLDVKSDEELHDYLMQNESRLFEGQSA